MSSLSHIKWNCKYLVVFTPKHKNGNMWKNKKDIGVTMIKKDIMKNKCNKNLI